MTEQDKTPIDIAALLADLRRPANYIWREIEREGEDAAPLRVKVLDLTTKQTEDIPWGTRVKLRESYEAIAPYVVAWDLRAENIRTGEMIDVPPPAEAGPEVFELLTNAEGSALVNWLKVPTYMKAELEKKSQPSTSTSKRPKRRG